VGYEQAQYHVISQVNGEYFSMIDLVRAIETNTGPYHTVMDESGPDRSEQVKTAQVRPEETIRSNRTGQMTEENEIMKRDGRKMTKFK
jgi:hypothetical protein